MRRTIVAILTAAGCAGCAGEEATTTAPSRTDASHNAAVSTSLAEPVAAVLGPTCLLQSGPLTTLTGSQSAYKPATLPDSTKVDASAASWTTAGDHPVTATAHSLCWSGGLVQGTYALNTSWNTMHSTAGLLVAGAGLTVENVRISDYGDGVRLQDSTDNWTIRGTYVNTGRDDCIENDRLYGGLLEDDLFEGCYVFLSERPGTGVTIPVDGRGKTVTIQNSLVYLRPMQAVYRGPVPGTGPLFKWDNSIPSRGTALVINNTIFRVDQPPNHGGLDIPSPLTSCANNTIVWLGQGPYPVQLPSCFTVVTDRTVWDNAISAWKSAHPLMPAGGPGPAVAITSTAKVPPGVIGGVTNIEVQAKDAYVSNVNVGGASVTVAISGTNSAIPPVVDHGDGTYSAVYTPTVVGTDQVAIALNGTGIDGSPYASIVSVGSGMLNTIALDGGNDQSATVGTAVAIPPSVKVTDASNNPVSGVAVTFAVGSGGGSVTGGAATTNPSGIATVGNWTLGTTAGTNNNSLTASSGGLSGSPVTFTASATPGPVNAATSTATVPNGTVGSPTTIAVQAKDQYANNLTTGGAAVVVTVSGANSASPAVTDNSNGTYSASYTPTTAGSDQVAITLGGIAISGSPYPSAVAGGTATTVALNVGNNQSATVNTTVATAPSVRVTDASSHPVAGVAVTFAVTLGGGSITGASQTTDANCIATVGSWTLGTKSGSNKLTATSAGLTGSPVTFTATGTAGAPTAIAVNAGDNQTAPVGTALATRPSVKVTDTYGNGASNVAVTFAVTAGGGRLSKASVKTGSSGVATAGRWTLGPLPGPNTLTVTASGAGIANNPVTFTATGT